MLEQYHDAMVIRKFYSHSYLFVTYICNLAWTEIKYILNLILRQRPED